MYAKLYNKKFMQYLMTVCHFGLLQRRVKRTGRCQDGQSVRRAVNNSEDCGASDRQQQLLPTSAAPSGWC